MTVGAKGSDLKAGGRKDFPLGLVEGQENIKTALLLTAINPEISVRLFFFFLFWGYTQAPRARRDTHRTPRAMQL